MDGRCVRVTRGFGYWCWKPQVILQALRQINDGDILLYADIGCEFFPKGRENLLKRIKELQGANSDIMGFATTEQECKLSLKKFGFDVREKTWAKMDIFHHFGVQNDPAFTDTPTVAATMMMMMKTNKTIGFMQEWLDVFKHHWHLVDDSESKLANFAEFVENRHDQSIYSIMNKKYGFKNFLFRDIEPAYDENADGSAFGFLASRKSRDTMGHLFDFNGKAKFNLGANAPLNVRSKTLKRFLYIGGRILPSKKARKQCRAWLGDMQ